MKLLIMQFSPTSRLSKPDVIVNRMISEVLEAVKIKSTTVWDDIV
jgi:hypothetical protein